MVYYNNIVLLGSIINLKNYYTRTMEHDSVVNKVMKIKPKMLFFKAKCNSQQILA